MIQHKVVLGIAVLLWATRYKHIIVPKEVLQAANLEKEGWGQRQDEKDFQKGINLIVLFWYSAATVK